jgi:hypothetical protein
MQGRTLQTCSTLDWNSTINMLGLGFLTQMFAPAHGEPNANAPADTPSDHDQIKAIVEPLRQIHETLTENIFFERNSH